MKKRSVVWAMLGIAAIFSVVLMWAFFGTHTVVLTEAQIQERINGQLDREFPVKGATGLVVKTVELQSTEVHIENGKVLTLVSLNGTLILGKQFSLIVSAVGVPSYRNGAFYFTPDQVEVKEFSYQGSTPGQALKNFADKYITNDGINAFVTDHAAKVEAWVSDLAETAAMHVLDKRPVYELKNDNLKSYVIRAALEKVEVGQNDIAITFSLMQLTISVAIGALILLAALVMAVALLMNPELLIGLFFVSIFTN